MDNEELAKSIIGSEYGEGIDSFCKISKADPAEIILIKLWVRAWFDPGKSKLKDEELAVQSLSYIISLEMEKNKNIKIIKQYHPPAKKRWWQR